MLVEASEGRNEAGEGAADGKFGDAVFHHALGYGIDVLVPDDFVKINQVVFCVDALAVGPEHGPVDSVILQASGLLCDGSFKKFNFLHGVVPP